MWSCWPPSWSILSHVLLSVFFVTVWTEPSPCSGSCAVRLISHEVWNNGCKTQDHMTASHDSSFDLNLPQTPCFTSSSPEQRRTFIYGSLNTNTATDSPARLSITSLRLQQTEAADLRAVIRLTVLGRPPPVISLCIFLFYSRVNPPWALHPLLSCSTYLSTFIYPSIYFSYSQKPSAAQFIWYPDQ